MRARTPSRPRPRVRAGDPSGALTTIVIVTYEGLRTTQACLADLFRNTAAPFELVIVDNDSRDGTRAWLRGLQRPNTRVLLQDRNLGFAAGCNVGAAAARGERLLFLNPDTRLPPGWLTRLGRALDAHPGVAMVGPRTNLASNEQRLPDGFDGSERATEATASALARAHAEQLRAVQRLIGFCLLVRRAAFERVGGFDERYGVGHYEDDDLCAALARAGEGLAVADDVYVHHVAGQSFESAGIDKIRNMRRNAFRFYQKWGNRYLGWPDLRHNLQDTLQVVAPFGAGLPRWREGQMPFLVSAIGGPHEAARLAQAWQRDELYDYVAGPPGLRSRALATGERLELPRADVDIEPLLDEVARCRREGRSRARLPGGARYAADARRRWARGLPGVRTPRVEPVPPASDVVNVTMLSYGRLAFTQEALRALRDHTEHPHRVVVVDNGSEPEVVRWLEAARRDGLIDVLALHRDNRGVAAAANDGWRLFETRHYVKLDNDIVIHKRGWLRELVHAAEAIEDCGMIGYSFEHRRYPVTLVDGHRVRPVASLGGACVLVPERGHRAVGFWCEDYFPYSEEDLDMGLRLRHAGLRCYYMEDEDVGLHLPRGRATELAGLTATDDEDDPAYRAFKDAARARHATTTLRRNRRLYRLGLKSLRCD